MRLTLPSLRALIKVASPNDAIAQENLQRESQIYRLPGVASAACFRRLYDVIDGNALALEWLDTTLAEVNYRPDLDSYVLVSEFLKAALTSCAIPDSQGFVNTGTAVIVLAELLAIR